MRRLFLLLTVLLCALPLSLTSCQSTGGPKGGARTSPDDSPAVRARNAAIRQEAPGDYYIGRRYFVSKTRFWGYLRKPGQLWEEGQLVIMSERKVPQPDRLPELAPEGNSHGYDHNVEYRIRGRFTGRTLYDPNADMELPEFEPVSYEVINERPGFLFSPRDRYDPRYIPARELKRTTPSRMW